jgi:hypothetical protein
MSKVNEMKKITKINKDGGGGKTIACLRRRDAILYSLSRGSVSKDEKQVAKPSRETSQKTRFATAICDSN